ncbi:Translation initiation factor eIF-2B subunit gamma [Massospora cicadina]|nr:Translation initiation factor eIF-2B subunit gamma [Massospora cicadina]
MFFDETAARNLNPTKLPIAFHAVIFVEENLSHPSLNGLTRDLPLSLLPVANRPLLHYLLEWLEVAEVKEATLVVPPTSNLQAEAQLAQYLTKVYDGGVRVGLHPLKAPTGSAQVLVQLKSQLQGHVIVLSGDFLATAPLASLLTRHRLHLPALTAYFYEPSKADSNPKDTGEQPPIIGVEPTRSQWVFFSSKGEDLALRPSLLRHFPRVQMHRTLLDSGVYIFSPWVVDFLIAMPNLTSLARDLVPLLVKMQSRPTLGAWEHLKAISRDSLTRQFSTLPETSTWHTVSLDTASPKLVCQVVMQRSGILGRLNSLQTYHEMNRQALRQGLEKSSQVGPESLVGACVKMAERSSIKKSVVGAHCHLGRNVKVANSVLMDHVVVEEGVKLEGCVVGPKAAIRERAQLKDCEVGEGVTVASEAQLKACAVWD